jgi:hypothetical protein
MLIHKNLLTADEVGDLLKMSTRTVQRLTASGDLRPVKGRINLYPAHEIWGCIPPRVRKLLKHQRNTPSYDGPSFELLKPPDAARVAGVSHSIPLRWVEANVVTAAWIPGGDFRLVTCEMEAQAVLTALNVRAGIWVATLARRLKLDYDVLLQALLDANVEMGPAWDGYRISMLNFRRFWNNFAIYDKL